jgi:hypothetical protein
MTTIGHAFVQRAGVPAGLTPTPGDHAHFESLPIPLAIWQSLGQRLLDHLSELSGGEIEREETFSFEPAHLNAMIAVIEAEAITAAPALRDGLSALAALARRAADRHVAVVFVIG